MNTLVGNSQNRITEYTALVLATDPEANTSSVVMGALNTGSASGSGQRPFVTVIRQSDDNQAVVPQSFRMVAFGEYATDGTASAFKARDYKDATDLAVGQVGVPRRLTPVECERLMGWPDGWTDVPDEKGKPAPDTARYKACGNGVASPVAAWIGFRLREALEARHG